MDIAACLESVAPGEAFAITDNDYETLRWWGESKQPTLAECEKAWARIEHDYLLRPIRAERDALLAASDWTQISDAPVDAKAWAAYRQALRDLPETIKDPTVEIDWPEPPK
jgi:hypothetical protein